MVDRDIRRLLIGAIVVAVIVVGGLFLADRWNEHLESAPQSVAKSQK